MRVVLVLLFLVLEIGIVRAEWTVTPVPGPWVGAGHAWHRCWVKVPDHWTVMTGRPLYRESVTFTLGELPHPHEVFVNGTRIGGSGGFPPAARAPDRAGILRYKVPPGSLLKNRWNEILIHAYVEDEEGGSLAEAPSIQGYFLECLLAGQWELRQGEKIVPGKSLAQKPSRAAYAQFVEASRLLGEAAELVPGPRNPPEESLKLMTTEKDLVVEELLTEPLVAQPTHLSFDDRGRLWVSQYRQYPYPAGLKQISRDKYYRAKYDQEPKAPPHHNRGRSRITIHADEDGDGRYDNHKVFLDGLDLANAALPGTAGVWVMHTPYLLFYPDRDRDDVPDGDPVVHLAGFGFEDTHSIANGLIWGPDGWIYGGQGSTVASRVWRPGIDADRSKGHYFEGCMVWRYHPRNREFEIFAEGGGNVFGLEFDAEGRLFSGHNGGNTRGWHYLQGGYFLKQGRTPNKFGPPAHPYAFGDLPMMRSANPIPRFSHNTIVCEGTALPTRMQGHIVAADPIHHHLVLAERLRRGSTFETRDLGYPLQSSEHAFRPVYLCNAPDGSIYVADFYDYYIAHGQHYQSQIDPSTGRIYRLRGRNAELEGAFNLAAMKTGDLLELFSHPNKWHRQMALRVLAGRQESGLRERLEELIRHEDARVALHALWARCLIAEPAMAVVRSGLAHDDPAVRAWTIRLAGDQRQAPEGAAEAMRILSQTEKDLEVWAQLASSAQRLPAHEALPVIAGLLRRCGDLDDPNLPLMLWWAVEKHCDAPETVLALFEAEELRAQPLVRREILPRIMRRFAATGREADLQVCARLLRAAGAGAERDALMAGFEQAFAGGKLPDLPDELERAMASGGKLSLVLRMRGGLGGALAEARSLIRDAKTSPAERVRLIGAWGEVAPEGGEEFLLDRFRDEEDSAVQQALLLALRSYSSPAIAGEVLERYGVLPDRSRVAAQALLSSRASWSRAWLKAVQTGKLSRDGINAEALATMRAHGDEVLSAMVRALFGGATVVRDARSEVERVRAIVQGKTGSPYRGRPIFKQRCASCHILFHEGGRIGPDLTAYQRDDLETMLTSVVDPNAEIREGFEGVQVKTRDGRVLSGFITDKAAKNVRLRGFDGSEVYLPGDEVQEVEPLGRSLMPEGLLGGLSDQELRDLFAYLRSAQPFLKD